jgi:hypothetical protein
MRICLLVLLLAVPTVLCAEDTYMYFTEAQSLNGYTGYIDNFSTKTVPERKISFGLHRFMAGVNYGFMKFAEAGLNTDLKNFTAMPSLSQENIDRKLDEVSLSLKYRVLREEEHPLDVTIGSHRETFYAAAGKFFPALRQMRRVSVQGGISWNRRDFDTFITITESLDWQQTIFEFAPTKDIYSFGWRFLVSPEMKLDFFLKDFKHLNNILFNNFVFGMTIMV